MPGKTSREAARAAAPELFDAQRRRLWGLAYRLTGSDADADESVQEAFTRFLERPPPPGQPPHAWLVRVTVNLALDALRRRRRRAYPGPWLPAPVERDDADWLDSFASDSPDAERRYDLLESASTAFLVALEALRPRERAVLILRDVLGWRAAECAELLHTTEGNVRVVHLRARRALESYDRTRCVPTPELRARHRAALEGLLAALVTQDTATVESLLAESVVTTTDAGGEFTALAKRLTGRERVARFYLQAALMRREAGPRVTVRTVNGLPAATIVLARPVRRQGPKTVLQIELDSAGRIASIFSVLAPRKLGSVSFA
jgi:RNA polymerase sigma factor (sigma-70 family)